MSAAPFRITLTQTGKRPRSLTRLVGEGCLNGAVLCASQWLVWSNDKSRGKLPKYGWYRVETRNTNGSWCEAASGDLNAARLAWTKEDDARIEDAPSIRPLIGVQGTTRHGRARSLRTEKRPQSRLAQLVQKMQQTK